MKQVARAGIAGKKHNNMAKTEGQKN